MVSKSRGTTVLGKIARASSRSCPRGWRVETWLSASRVTSASVAIVAACWAVEWPLSAARSRSSSANVASWTSTSARWAAMRSASHGRVSPDSTSLRPGRAGPRTWSGVTPRIVSPRWTRPNSGPSCRPRRSAVSLSKLAGALVLVEHVAERRAAMRDRHRRDPVPVALELVAGLELDQLELEAHGPRHPQRQAHQRPQPGRAADRQRDVAAAEVERLEHAGQAQPVVGVKVGEEDLGEVGQSDGAHELALGPLAAVEQDPVTAAADQDRGQAAAGGGDRAAGAGKEDRELHGSGLSVSAASRLSRARTISKPQLGARVADRPSCGAAGGGGRSGCPG